MYRYVEALSLYMGHSVAMQKGTYDRRTQQQKVAPAIGEGVVVTVVAICLTQSLRPPVRGSTLWKTSTKKVENLASKTFDALKLCRYQSGS